MSLVKEIPKTIVTKSSPQAYPKKYGSSTTTPIKKESNVRKSQQKIEKREEMLT